MSKKYALDANVFIEAKNRYYRFSLCPGYWKALIARHNEARVVSVDKVRDELIRTRNEGEQAEPRDLLSDWAKDSVPETFFKKTQDKAVVSVFKDIVDWVNARSQFTPAARAEFASAADGWLVAFAKANGLIVVTQEVYAPAVRNRVPIPNVCLEFNVDCVDTFEMLESLKVQFVLKIKQARR